MYFSVFDSGDLDAQVSRTKEIAKESNALSEEVVAHAGELEDQINAAPDPDVDLAGEFDSTKDKCKNIFYGQNACFLILVRPPI